MAVGIIAEYNPFHNGHLYHIKKIKEMFPEEVIILVVNGYFLQRGEISILTKEAKTKIALANGIDLVISLPFYYGIHSADNFAYGAIKILNELKASKIVFGSENGDIKKLIEASNNISTNNFNNTDNFSYPSIISNVNTPNDLLGIAYIKAINLINKNIIPIAIQRTNNFHDLASNDSIISASNIRNKIANNLIITKYVPTSVKDNIIKINNNDLFKYLKYKILTEDTLDKYLLVEEGLNFKIKKVINNANSFDELVKKIKSKRYTYVRIQRMLICILIGYEKRYFEKDNLDFIQILGFNIKGQKHLSELNIKKIIDNKKSIIYQLELKVSNIYSLISQTNTYQFDYSHKPIKKAL